MRGPPVRWVASGRGGQGDVAPPGRGSRGLSHVVSARGMPSADSRRRLRSSSSPGTRISSAQAASAPPRVWSTSASIAGRELGGVGQRGDVDGDQQVAGAAAAVGLVGAGHRVTERAAGQHPGQDVHHERDDVALGPGHRQDQALRSPRRGRWSGVPSAAAAQPSRDLLAALRREVDLAAGDGRVGQVHDDHAVAAGRGRDRPGVGADRLDPPAPRRHGRAGVGDQEGDAAGLGGLPGEVGGGAEVAGVADGDRR